MATASAPTASTAAPVASAILGDAAIQVSNVKKYFGVTRALDGCSFSARLGEIHAIVGGNGCGKSTLAKVLSGVLPFDSGQVTVLGRTPTTPAEAREVGIATVFQEVLVADECSIVDNLYMGADHLFSKTQSASARLRAAETLMRDLTGEPVDCESPVGTLPLSLKQWITIGRALLIRPKVLILDESSAALDLDSTERLFAKMRELRDQGSAVLIVTHRIAELIKISDRATVMRDGRDVGVLERSDITERNLLQLMTGHAPEARISHGAQERVMHAAVAMKARGLRVWPGAAPVDIDIHRGEVLGVAGLDGQGQSEFVRVLAGVQAAAAGAVEVRRPDGSYTPVRSLSEAIAAGVVYVSGDRKKEGIFANLSIYENMLMPLYRAKMRGGILGVISWKSLEGIFNWEREKLLIKMGDRGNKITSLSGGNQQKVLIGRAFAMNPDVMVLNDPARGIDVGAKSELYKHLKAFADSGKSVVYMSSELEEFIGFATRVIVFRAGSVFDAFNGDELEPARILEAMFGQTPGLGSRKLAGTDGGAVNPAAKVAVDVVADERWRRPAEPVENPLKPARPRQPNPLKPAPAAEAPKPVRPSAPYVPHIKIVEFDDRDADRPARDPFRPDFTGRDRR
jgi:ribose transport system ATP-binding protein